MLQRQQTIEQSERLFIEIKNSYEPVCIATIEHLLRRTCKGHLIRGQNFA